MTDAPRVGITLGDPAGVGPQLVATSLSAEGEEGAVVFGDAGALASAAQRAGVRVPRRIVEVTSLGRVEPGRPDARAGAAQVAYLEAAIDAARRGELDAIVTAPINKALCHEAGLAFPGHTELLAARLGAPEVAMMLAGPRLRVVPATIHVAFVDVPRLLGAALTPAIVLTALALHREFGVAQPRVAVAGLNPHAGEAGHFGDEERRVIAPAIELARARLDGIVPVELSGPHVPDVVYRAACAPPVGEGRFDAVVGAYHDQALIPVKLLDFDETVNVTLGLPIPRTSPDHGVAYDAAASGRVRDGSFRAALRLARELARRRRAACA